VGDLNRDRGAHRLTDGEIDRARRAVAHRATDADDCRRLLDILGLLPDQPPPRSSPNTQRLTTALMRDQ
jgi:hypothetical protein